MNCRWLNGWTRLLLAAGLLAFSGIGCSADTVGSVDEGEECSADEDCADGLECVEGTCTEVDDGPDVDAGVDADTADPDSDVDTDAGGELACPTQTSCEQQEVQCGLIADGCGGTLQCGMCTGGQICDDGQCIDTDCAPSASCTEQNIDCGPIADGCGGTIDCGSCGEEQKCVAGQCEDEQTECTPRECNDIGPDPCGPHSDGCGGVVDCGGCAEGLACVDGGCQTPSCTPMDCGDHSPGECGPHPDGCGGTIDCGDNCDEDEVCGTGEDLGECLEPSCTPLTCSDYQDINCGPVSDGCSGVTNSCGTCEEPDICGGGGQPNVCGSEGQDECENLCEDQALCSGGEATTLRGTVVSPNEQLPIPNAVVYVPNVPLSELPDVAPATQCIQCEDEDLGEPLVGAISDHEGNFELRHVPADVEFPLVVKIGQWRRVVTISPKDPCSTTDLDTGKTRLPTRHQEQSEHDNIPRTAVSTGAIDAMECVLLKMGVEESEFTRRTEDGRIHLYRANGGVADQELADACDHLECGLLFCSRTCWSNSCTDRYPDCPGPNGHLLEQNLSHHLYSDQATLDSYDMVIMDCERTDHSSYRSGGDLERIRNYVNGGGRLFASHWAYDWLHQNDELQDTADWSGSGGGSFSHAYVDTSFSGGVDYWNWLQLVDADAPGPNGEPQIAVTDPRGLIQSVNSNLATRWSYTDSSAHEVNYDAVQQFTFNTPVHDPADQQCGQVTYTAYHVANVDNRGGPAFPGYCGSGEMTDQEKTLAYMLFDLAACVAEDGEPPEPVCEPLTCEDYGADCGTIADGCGDTVDCGECPEGSVCGGGGTPHVCSGGCEPLSCEDHGADCGEIDDGCGGTVDCGECPEGVVCGGSGTPNVCGCDAVTCEDHGAECGTVDDGCGNTLDCGECPEGTTCGEDGVPNRCGGDCPSLSCADHGAECGTVDDGCGNTLECGDCPEPDTCGGTGEPNVCGCTPLTCDDHNAECGTVDDGCGDTLDCGDCPESMICDNFQCVEEACRPTGDPCEVDSQCCSNTCAISASDDIGECISN